MLYELAHKVQKSLPWIWEGIESLNSLFFSLRIAGKGNLDGCLTDGVRILGKKEANRLSEFFARQPEESYRWFRPHAFDEKTLSKLLQRKSYIIYVLEEDGMIIGYAFLRCFFNGKCFLGKMVDIQHQGKGVCTKLCSVGMSMSETLGLRMFESINKENIGSMKASQKACDVIVVEELEDGDVLIEDRPNGSMEKRIE
jgi:hypothetical protein